MRYTRICKSKLDFVYRTDKNAMKVMSTRTCNLKISPSLVKLIHSQFRVIIMWSFKWNLSNSTSNTFTWHLKVFGILHEISDFYWSFIWEAKLVSLTKNQHQLPGKVTVNMAFSHWFLLSVSRCQIAVVKVGQFLQASVFTWRSGFQSSSEGSLIHRWEVFYFRRVIFVLILNKHCQAVDYELYKYQVLLLF